MFLLVLRNSKASISSSRFEFHSSLSPYMEKNNNLPNVDSANSPLEEAFQSMRPSESESLAPFLIAKSNT